MEGYLKFSDLSIKRKITYLYLPLAVLPMIFFALISMKIYEGTIIKRSLASMEDNTLLIANRIEGILSETESSATLLTININRVLNSDAFHGILSNDIKLYNLISNELAYAKLIYKHIDSIGFYDRSGRLYYSDFALQENAYKISKSALYEKLQKTTGYSIWFDFESRDFLTKNPGTRMLTLGKKIWNINSGETIGYLFINLSESIFHDMFKEQLATYDIYRGEVSYFLEKHDTATRDFLNNKALKSDRLTHENNAYIVSKIPIERMNWMLLSRANVDLLTEDLSNLVVLLVIILITVILLEIFMTMVLNKLITNPITKLKQGVEEIAMGNFDYRFKMKTNDEIGLFAQRFNNMSSEIKKLLNDVAREERKKREYELALIQQQIKPHFLYNSLDIILKLSQLGQNRRAQKVIRRLADYYRHSLSGGADVISVKDEINITRDYLELQKLRYSEVFDYEIDLGRHSEGKMIPKLSLQPIVENAIDHGFKNQSEQGYLKIYDMITESAYEIIIEDNGVGIPDERLSTLRSLFDLNYDEHSGNKASSFGLKNVNHRLKLFFGMAYGVDIISVEGVGTTIKLRIPKDENDD